VKRLERSRKDRVVQGVCGGLGEYLGVDSNLIRILWILSIVLGGVGILPYLVAIFLLPEGEAPDEPRSDTATRILGFLLIALAVVFFLKAFHVGWLGAHVFAFWTLSVLLPLALLLAGIFLVWPRSRDAVGFARKGKPHRSASDRVIAGVAGGIARELGTDANLVRLAFVAAAVVTSGFAALIYLLLVLILPEEDLDGAAATPPASPPRPAAAPPAPAPPPPGSDAPSEASGPSSHPDSGATRQEPEADRR